MIARDQIVFCLPDSLGLGLSLLPALRLLRARYPEVKRVAVAEDRCRFDAAVQKDFDDWVDLPRSWPQRIAVVWQLRSRSPDVVVQPVAPGWWLQAIGAGRRVEFSGCRQFVSLLATPEAPTWQSLATNLVDEFALESPLAADAVVAERIQRVRESTHLTGRFFVIAADPGCDAAKNWTPEQFGKAARAVGERQQIPSLVVWWGESGRLRAERVAAQSGGHALVAPAMSLSDIAECLRQSELALSGDRDFLHIAELQAAGTVHPFSIGAPAPAGDSQYDVSPEHVAERCLLAAEQQQGLGLTRRAA